jgi:hypothetical protein
MIDAAKIKEKSEEVSLFVAQTIAKSAEVNEMYKILAKDVIKKIRSIITLDDSIATISWTQYAPSWNDGEPCYFSVNDNIRVELKDGRTWETYNDNESRFTGDEEAQYETLSILVCSITTGVEGAIMETLTDDGRVTVTPTDHSVEYVNHD